jgi:hypothetical protein
MDDINWGAHPAPTVLFSKQLSRFNFNRIFKGDSILKTKISGTLTCKTAEDAKKCSKILDEYKINHTIQDIVVEIKSTLDVTPWFDRDGFEKFLIGRMPRIKSIITISVPF